MSVPKPLSNSVNTSGDSTLPALSTPAVRLEGEQAVVAAAIDAVSDNLFEDIDSCKKIDQHAWGDVIVLIGSSTAGKSSIIAELLKQRSDFVEDGGDLASVNIPLLVFKRECPKDLAFVYKVIEPDQERKNGHGKALILDYIVGSEEPVFKEGVTEKEKIHFNEATMRLRQALPPGQHQLITKLMMDEILMKAKGGNPVIFDALQIKDIYAHALGKEHPSLKVALVFCSFQELATRVINRNEAALKINPDDVRPGVFPLQQFSKLFRPRRDESDVIVQTLTKKQAEEAFDKAWENGKEYFKKYQPKKLGRGRNFKKWEKVSKAKLLHRLGFKEGDGPDKIVELTPRFKGYDIVICTDKKEGELKEVSSQRHVERLLWKPDVQ